MDPWREPRVNPIQLIAHRGGGARHVNPHAPPENTLPAFQWAYRQAIRTCECDVQMSADEQVVVFHDFDLQRITGVDAQITDLTLAQIQTLDAGTWKSASWRQCRIPTLEQVLQEVPQDGRLLIEIKPGPQILSPLTPILAAAPDPAQLILASFNLDTMVRAKRQWPDLTCLWVLEFRQRGDEWTARYRGGDDAGHPIARPARPDELLHEVQEANLDGVDFSLAHPPQFAERFLEAGRTTMVWTVNDPGAARRLINQGINHLTTDLPLELRAGLDEHAEN